MVGWRINMADQCVHPAEMMLTSNFCFWSKSPPYPVVPPPFRHSIDSCIRFIYSVMSEMALTRSLFSACTVMQWKIKMKTIQYRRTRIWEMKKDKYTKALAKNQVCEIFQMRDIGKNGLPKFIKLCMETPCWCPFQEHQYGRRIPTETSVFEFSY